MNVFLHESPFNKGKDIDDFVKDHESGKPSFEDWLTKIKNADWNEPLDMKSTFNSVDFLGNGSNRVVFNIGGNNFRLIGKYGFGIARIHLFVCWISPNKEYNELCKINGQYTVDRY